MICMWLSSKQVPRKRDWAHLLSFPAGRNMGPVKLTMEGVEMPVIRVDGPRIEVDKKRELARRLTDVAAEVYGMPPEHIIVLIHENDPENVSVGGKLIADRQG